MSTIHRVGQWHHGKWTVYHTKMAVNEAAYRPSICSKCNRAGRESFDAAPSGHPYVRGSGLCPECMDFVEYKFVRDMQIEDLPLYINHAWVTGMARRYFLGRLSEGVGLWSVGTNRTKLRRYPY